MDEPEIGRVVVWYTPDTSKLTPMVLLVKILERGWVPADCIHEGLMIKSYTWEEAINRFDDLDGPYNLYRGEEVGRI